MSAAKHAFVSSTCDTCHDTGKSFYVGSGTPLQLRPADHVNSADPRMASSDCSVCHETKDWISTAMPAGHMPNPSNLTCVQCHASAPSDYTPATLAAISVLHTGINGNCGLCHGNTISALTWFNNFTPKDALLTPAHIPYLSGTDCSSCHARELRRRRLRSHRHERSEACLRAHRLRYLPRGGLELLHGRRDPGAAGPPGRSHGPTGTPQQQTGDCSGCHETTDWNTTVMPAGHMPNPGNQACAVCHTAIGGSAASYATLASIAVLHTGISGNCGQCHGARHGQLTFYNNNDNPKAAVLTPSHIPYPVGQRLQLVPCGELCRGRLRPHQHERGQARLRSDHLRHLPRGGAELLHGRLDPGAAGPPGRSHGPSGTPQQQTGDCSGCHETTDWNSTALPAGHMPNPGNQACTVCHIAAPGNYATLAANSVLHTGISTGCAQCHGGAAALTFYNNNDNPKSAVLSPPHIPAFTGTDCSNCHSSSTYAVGDLRPDEHDPGDSRRRRHNLQHLPRGGLELLHGRGEPGAAGAPGRSHRRTAGRAERLQPLPHHGELEHHGAAGRPHAEPGEPGVQRVPHRCADQLRDARRQFGAAHRHQRRLRPVPRRHHTADLLQQQRQPEGRRCSLPRISRTCPERIAAPATHRPTYAVGGFGPMNMTQANHAFVADDVRHLP